MAGKTNVASEFDMAGGADVVGVLMWHNLIVVVLILK